MDHAELLADTTYAAWPEHRQEAHRALCLAAYHYAAVAYEPGPIMDTICAEVLGDQGHDIGARPREALARAVLALPLPDLDRPQRPSGLPRSWERRGHTPWPECAPLRAVDLGEIDADVQARDERRMADALRARLGHAPLPDLGLIREPLRPDVRYPPHRVEPARTEFGP